MPIIGGFFSNASFYFRDGVVLAVVCNHIGLGSLVYQHHVSSVVAGDGYGYWWSRVGTGTRMCDPIASGWNGNRSEAADKPSTAFASRELFSDLQARRYANFGNPPILSSSVCLEAPYIYQGIELAGREPIAPVECCRGLSCHEPPLS